MTLYLNGFFLLVGAFVLTEVSLRALIGKWDRLRTALAMQDAGIGKNPRFKGHPFRQYIRNNDFGISGRIPESLEKPPETTRICCFGGSTTESGWPGLMQDILDQNGRKGRYEVINFGTSGYTTAHSLVTYMLTAIDFEPDVVIIHHAVNDILPLKFPDPEIKGDYSHIFYSFKIRPFSAFLRKTFVTYAFGRWFILKLLGKSRVFALETPTRHLPPLRYAEMAKLAPAQERLRFYRRNLRSMIQKALADGVNVVLVTQPYCEAKGKARGDGHQRSPQAEYMDTANRLCRDLAREFDIYICDLEPVMTGRAELFLDFAHPLPEGEALKARHIASRVLEVVARGGSKSQGATGGSAPTS